MRNWTRRLFLLLLPISGVFKKLLESRRDIPCSYYFMINGIYRVMPNGKAERVSFPLVCTNINYETKTVTFNTVVKPREEADA